MQITSVQYYKDSLTNQNVVIQAIIDGLTCSVPISPANTHYAEIMRQVEAGDLTIAEAD